MDPDRERQAATQSGGEAFEVFYTISRREISKLIVGQTLSAEAQSTGLGSGVANAQGEVRDDYRKFDGKILGETYRDKLFRQFHKINFVKAGVPKISWGSVSTTEAKATGELLASITTAGLRVADSGLDALSEKLGFPIERVASPLAPLALAALAANSPLGRLERADNAIDDIARAGAADLSRAFRGRYAPIRQMILESRSAEELEGKLAAWQAGAPGEVGNLLEEALLAYSANGAAR